MLLEAFILTSMEKLAPFFEAYSEKVKRRRNEVGMTISALSERSGVPYSNVSRVNSGVQANPLLYNEAAIADTLGLSLDALFGLAQPAGSPSELQERNHQLELENAKLVTTNEAQKAQIRSTHTICYVLVFFCIMLTLSLIVYLMIDSQITNAGIIRGGRLSGAAWVFIGLIVASVVAAGITILRIIRKENQHEEDQSPRS